MTSAVPGGGLRCQRPLPVYCPGFGDSGMKGATMGAADQQAGGDAAQPDNVYEHAEPQNVYEHDEPGDDGGAAQPDNVYEH